MSLKPITRQEQIIAGKDLQPITRMEKFLKEYRGGGGASVPSDWNAAEGEPGHVLNRTHWVEYGDEVEILPETEAVNDGDGFFIINAVIPAEIGKTYTVNWNGVEYKATALDGATMDLPPCPIIINDGVNMETGEGIVFAIVCGGNDGSTYSAMSFDVSTSVTLSIKGNGEVIHKLPGKFLPDGVPYVEQGVLLAETSAVSSTNPNFGVIWTISDVRLNLTVGENYTIIYNGTPYPCVCQTAPDGFTDDPTAVAMGNFAAAGGTDTGEPFVLMFMPVYQQIAIIDLVGSTAVKVGFSGNVGYSMDDRCIPDTARVLVVKFKEREDGSIVSLSHTYQQILSALWDGVPVVGFVQYFSGYGGSTAIVGCAGTDCWVNGSDATVSTDGSTGEIKKYVGEMWRRAIEYSVYYLDGDISNKTIGNELWKKLS